MEYIVIGKTFSSLDEYVAYMNGDENTLFFAIHATNSTAPIKESVDPSDIHSYVDCGEIVQHSKIDDNGDFGDVELEEIVSDRYVTIYSDGTYYYMFNYMDDMITIAYIE